MTKFMFVFVAAYPMVLIYAHKYGGCHVDGKWLIPLLAALGFYFWRDHRASRHPRSR